jgi:hypothetical protein
MKVAFGILLAIVLVVGFVYLFLRAHHDDTDPAGQFEDAMRSGDWNNTLSGLVRSNRADAAHDMLRLRVAYEVADLWRWRTNQSIPPHILEEAEGLFVEARPTIQEAMKSSNFMTMPSVSRELLLDYLRATNTVGQK